MADNAETPQVEPDKAPEGAEQKQEKTFTQAEVDRIVRDRAERLAKQLFPDYDDLKTKAEGAKTLEDRLSELETELKTTKVDALRASVAARFGISTEKGKDGSPSDADLFLTGTDEATLTTQAERLAARQADLKKQGNVARNEGGTINSGTSEEQELRNLASNLFGGGAE